MNKMHLVLAFGLIISLSGCGNKPDMTAIKAELDQIQQRQMMMWTNNYYLWSEMESIRTNVARLPDAATINSIAYFYHTNELNDAAEKLGTIMAAFTDNRQGLRAGNDMLLTKIQEVEDGQSSDRKAESNYDLKEAEYLNDIDTNAIDANFKLDQIKIRLNIP